MVKTVPKGIHKKETKHYYTIGVLCQNKRIVVILIVRGDFHNNVLRGRVMGCMDRGECNAQKNCFINRFITVLINFEEFKRLC